MYGERQGGRTRGLCGTRIGPQQRDSVDRCQGYLVEDQSRRTLRIRRGSGAGRPTRDLFRRRGGRVMWGGQLGGAVAEFRL